LNCSNALRPILPKSQCWEVEPGKFVLQIRRPQYWRLEVYNKSNEEISRAEELKDVLSKVLLFEKTICPFQRSFTVELPELPHTPIKKRPWKPMERPRNDVVPVSESPDGEGSYFAGRKLSGAPSLSTTPVAEFMSISNPSVLSDDPALRIITTPQSIHPIKTVDSQSPDLDHSHSLPSIYNSEARKDEPRTNENSAVKTFPEETASATILKPSVLNSTISHPVFVASAGVVEDDSFSDASTPRSHIQPAFRNMTFNADSESRPQAIKTCSRSITAPPILSLVMSPPSKHRTKSPLRGSTVAESESDFSSSMESFHSVQSWHSPISPPSPPASQPSSPTSTYPYPHHNIVLPKRQHNSRDISEFTVSPETPRISSNIEPLPRSASPPPKTPTLVTDGSEKSDEEQFEVVTPPTTIRSAIRHRATTSSNSRRRQLSPLPATINLFSPSRRRPRRLQTARHLPTAILQKTFEILLSPPSHLVQLMLNIASKIAVGEWREVLSGNGEAVHWDFEDEYAGEVWTEDDYGISLPRSQSSVQKGNSNVQSGGSWEVD
jgi:hypothetical protein